MGNFLNIPDEYAIGYQGPRVKPVGDIEVNWDNKHSLGLVGAFVPSGKGDFFDLVNKFGATSGAFRDGQNSITTSGEIDLGTIPRLDDLRPISIFARVRANTSGSSSFFLRKGVSISAGGGYGLFQNSNSGKNIRFLKDGSGGDASVISANDAFVVGEFFDVVLAWDGITGGSSSGLSLSIDGVETVTAAPLGTYRNDAGQTFRINSSDSWSFEYLYFFNRRLSLEEGNQIRREPYQLVKSQVQPSYSIPEVVSEDTIQIVMPDELTTDFQDSREKPTVFTVAKSKFLTHASLLVAEVDGFDYAAKELPVDGGTRPSIGIMHPGGQSIEITTPGASTESWQYTGGVKYTGTDTTDEHTFLAVFKPIHPSLPNFGTMISTSSGDTGYRLAFDNGFNLQLGKGGVQNLNLGVTITRDVLSAVIVQKGESVTGYVCNFTTGVITKINQTFSSSSLNAGDGTYQIGEGNGFSSEVLISITGVSEIALSDAEAFSLATNPYQLLKRKTPQLYLVPSAEEPAAITGIVTSTLDNLTFDSLGIVTSSGALSSILDDIDSSSFGFLKVIGDTISTLDNLDSNSVGIISVIGNSASSFENINSVSLGTITVNGNTDTTLENINSNSDGALTVVGDSDSTLENISSVALGNVAGAAVTGSINSQLDSIDSVSSGKQIFIGNSISILDNFNSVSLGKVIVSGTLDIDLEDLNSNSDGVLIVVGSSIVNFEDIDSDILGNVFLNIFGDIASTLENLESNSSGFTGGFTIFEEFGITLKGEFGVSLEGDFNVFINGDSSV